jgi:hypothetical protein
MDQAEIQAEEDFGHKLGQYDGEWVAVTGHAVIAHDRELTALINGMSQREREDTEVFKVSSLPFV